MIIDNRTLINLDTPIDLEFEPASSTFLKNISKQEISQSKPKQPKVREVSHSKKSNTKALF